MTIQEEARAAYEKDKYDDAMKVLKNRYHNIEKCNKKIAELLEEIKIQQKTIEEFDLDKYEFHPNDY